MTDFCVKDILWLGVFRYSQSFAAYVTNTVKSLEVGVQWHRHFIGVIRSPPTSGQLDELQDAITFYQYNISAWPEATKLLGKLAVAGLIKVKKASELRRRKSVLLSIQLSKSYYCQISTDDILTYDTFALYAKAVASVSDRGIPLDNGKKIVESVTNMSHKSEYCNIRKTVN